MPWYLLKLNFVTSYLFKIKITGTRDKCEGSHVEIASFVVAHKYLITVITDSPIEGSVYKRIKKKIRTVNR